MASLTWDKDIKNYFTQRDIGAMRTAGSKFDLGSYEDVKRKAADIYSVVASGYMPQNGPRWPAEKVQNFKDWMDAGCPKSAADV